MTGLRAEVETRLDRDGVALLSPVDAGEALDRYRRAGVKAACCMLDPWYNKGVGGTRVDYVDYIAGLLEQAAAVADHVYLWGFPEIVARFVERLPAGMQLTAWLTWFYKNNPSVIRGWRSAQMACLHLSAPGAPLYPENFLNDAQLEKQRQGKLRYLPGPTSVIEAPLLVGFVGRREQTGHPAQKPVAVFDRLVRMVTREGELVIDPMCGSGTTGAVARQSGRLALLSDADDSYISLVEARLGIVRIPPNGLLGRDPNERTMGPWPGAQHAGGEFSVSRPPL
jgi:site-specific DNA-methyltransferase (adenine-specific)